MLPLGKEALWIRLMTLKEEASGEKIIADSGAVLIAGEDGFVSTGVSGKGEKAPGGGGDAFGMEPEEGGF